jgi:hypothetical protein
MHKRLEIVVRNPGFETTADAIGAYTIDFDEVSFVAALRELHAKLDGLTQTGRVIARFRNEKGEERGIDLQYYLSHQITETENWEPPKWSLPGHGGPPSRES